MREVTIGGERVNIVASPITPWIYEGEFDGEDMLAALTGLVSKKSEPKLFVIAKMAYAMARCARYPATFPDFATWLTSIGGWDSSDVELTQAVIFEAMKGCFPGKAGLVSAAEERVKADAVRASAELELPRDGEARGPVAD